MRRYSLTTEKSIISQYFHITEESIDAYSPIYNAAPTARLPVISCDKSNELTLMRWGIPPRIAKNKPVAEKISTIQYEDFLDIKNTVVRKNLCNHRVLIPADGFYFFKRIGKSSTIAYRFRLPKSQLFAIGGVFEDFGGGGDNKGKDFIFKIITKTYDRKENPFIPECITSNDSLPFILPIEAWDHWKYKHTSINDLELILQNHFFPVMKYHPVTHKISDPLYNSPEAIEEVPPMNNRGIYTLFD